jgi:hypothetical protein
MIEGIAERRPLVHRVEPSGPTPLAPPAITADREARPTSANPVSPMRLKHAGIPSAAHTRGGPTT